MQAWGLSMAYSALCVCAPCLTATLAFVSGFQPIATRHTCTDPIAQLGSLRAHLSVASSAQKLDSTGSGLLRATAERSTWFLGPLWVSGPGFHSKEQLSDNIYLCRYLNQAPVRIVQVQLNYCLRQASMTNAAVMMQPVPHGHAEDIRCSNSQDELLPAFAEIRLVSAAPGAGHKGGCTVSLGEDSMPHVLGLEHCLAVLAADSVAAATACSPSLVPAEQLGSQADAADTQEDFEAAGQADMVVDEANWQHQVGDPQGFAAFCPSTYQDSVPVGEVIDGDDGCSTEQDVLGPAAAQMFLAAAAGEDCLAGDGEDSRDHSHMEDGEGPIGSTSSSGLDEDDTSMPAAAELYDVAAILLGEGFAAGLPAALLHEASNNHSQPEQQLGSLHEEQSTQGHEEWASMADGLDGEQAALQLLQFREELASQLDAGDEAATQVEMDAALAALLQMGEDDTQQRTSRRAQRDMQTLRVYVHCSGTRHAYRWFNWATAQYHNPQQLMFMPCDSSFNPTGHQLYTASEVELMWDLQPGSLAKKLVLAEDIRHQSVQYTAGTHILEILQGLYQKSRSSSKAAAEAATAAAGSKSRSTSPETEQQDEVKRGRGRPRKDQATAAAAIPTVPTKEDSHRQAHVSALYRFMQKSRTGQTTSNTQVTGALQQDLQEQGNGAGQVQPDVQEKVQVPQQTQLQAQMGDDKAAQKQHDVETRGEVGTAQQAIGRQQDSSLAGQQAAAPTSEQRDVQCQGHQADSAAGQDDRGQPSTDVQPNMSSSAPDGGAAPLQPVKRGRGRPRKHPLPGAPANAPTHGVTAPAMRPAVKDSTRIVESLSKTQNDSHAPDAQANLACGGGANAAAQPAVKRGRGRPRKNSLPPQPVVKRGRGRPRKHPLPALPASNTAAVPAADISQQQAAAVVGGDSQEQGPVLDIGASGVQQASNTVTAAQAQQTTGQKRKAEAPANEQQAQGRSTRQHTAVA